MRTIRFRGKDKKSQQWVYGDLELNENGLGEVVSAKILTHNYIKSFVGGGFDSFVVSTPIICDTIGQSTGLLDKDGKEIYEGDIVRMSTKRFGAEIFQIGYEDSHIGAFVLCEGDIYSRFVSVFGVNYGYEPFYCKVIGNIHDNPELLKNND